MESTDQGQSNENNRLQDMNEYLVVVDTNSCCDVEFCTRLEVSIYRMYFLGKSYQHLAVACRESNETQ